jgi:hypothetical protein
MRARTSILVVGLALAAASVASAAEKELTLEQMTARAVELEQAIRRSSNAALRKHLTNRLELLLHQMGPVDARGRRVHPQAMWHDDALERLEAEEQRLARPMKVPGKGLAAQARFQVRRMARLCLTHGWRIREDALKYQVNVYGQYLATNLPLLDSRCAVLLDYLAEEGRMAEDGGGAEALKGHLDDARAAVETMDRAASAMDVPDLPADPESAVRPLGEFLGGLRAFHEAVAALEQAEEMEQPEGHEEAPAETPAATEDLPPPMTAEERRTLAAVREQAEALTGEGWDEIRVRLEQFATAIENGFQVPSARPKAREFLKELARAARLAESLHGSKAVYSEYLEDMRGRLKGALDRMESPLHRADGYARLAQVERDDAMRRKLEAGGLTPLGARGILYARLVVYPEMRRTRKRSQRRQANALRHGCDRIVDICDRLADWPPPDMTGRLPEFYGVQEANFQEAASQAGSYFPRQPGDGIPAVSRARVQADDLERLVRADRTIKAVKRYVPTRAGPMYAQLGTAAQELVHRDQAAAARSRLESLIRPFEGLESFPLPEPRHAPAARQLVGLSYAKARRIFSRDVVVGIDAASKGNPRALNHALNARWLFGLLRHRVVARTQGLEEIDVANLPSLAVPPRLWEVFRQKLDQDLRSRFAKYAAEGAQRHSWMWVPATWDRVYHPVLAGQRLAVDARSEGETDVAFLLRNIEQATVAEPSRHRWYNWAVAYHVVEAARTMDAGFAAAADWHRDQVRRYGGRLRGVDLEPDSGSSDR